MKHRSEVSVPWYRAGYVTTHHSVLGLDVIGAFNKDQLEKEHTSVDVSGWKAGEEDRPAQR